MNLWIALYHHRHGVDPYPYFQTDEPEVEQVIKDIDAQDGEGTYEGAGGSVPEEDQRDDEWIEVLGW